MNSLFISLKEVEDENSLLFTFCGINFNNDIIDNLVYGKPDRKKITFLEGWNMEQVAKHLEKEMKFNYSEVIYTPKPEK